MLLHPMNVRLNYVFKVHFSSEMHITVVEDIVWWCKPTGVVEHFISKVPYI